MLHLGFVGRMILQTARPCGRALELACDQADMFGTGYIGRT